VNPTLVAGLSIGSPNLFSALVKSFSLREVADDQSRHREELERLRRDVGTRRPITERLMVCLSLDPASSQELLRKGARGAARLNADWYAVRVYTPAESLKKINTEDFRALLDKINPAGDLGAEAVWLEGEDAFRRSVTDRTVAAAHDFDADIVNFQPRNR
jgi:K+-sensing histidine kinase KdpD